MADFASFKVKEGDEPQVINLDLVSTITAYDNNKIGSEAEFHIVFNRILEPVYDADGKKMPWYKQGSSELMRWEFKVMSLNDVNADVMGKKRDLVLKKLIDKERTFVLEQLVKPPVAWGPEHIS